MAARLSRRDRHRIRTRRVNSGFRIQASWPKRILYALIGRQL
jgi:hypothetical protein